MKLLLLLKIIALCLFIGASPYEIYAQKKPVGGVIKGRVIDVDTQKPIMYATVRLSTFFVDGEVLKATSTDKNGEFEFKGVKPGTYYLFPSFVGYRLSVGIAGFVNVESVDKVCVAADLKMKEGAVALEEVVVKPLVSVTSSEVVYNLDQDPDREKSSLYDLIDRVPMVQRGADGKIFIENPQASFLIVRNGKKDVLFDNEKQRDDLLKSLPAKAFSQVKIKLVPEARYGNFKYVMSINTDNKSQLVGVINQNSAEYIMSDGKIELTPRLLGSGTDLRFTAGLGFANTREPSSHSTLSQHFYGNDLWMMQWEKSYRTGEEYRPDVGVSYDLSERQFLTARFRFSGLHSRSKKTSLNERWIGDNAPTTYSVYSTPRTHSQDYSGEVDYQLDFIKPNRVLDIVYNVKYNTADRETNHEVDGDYTGMPLAALAGDNRTKQHTLQAHYFEPISKKWALEVGASYLLRDYQTKSSYTAGGKLLVEMADEMHSRKHILTDYVHLRYTSKKLTGSLNLASEYADDGRGTKVQRGSDAPEYILEDGFRLTPSFSLSYSLGDKLFVNRISTDYSWEKRRPSLWMMTSQVNNSNPNFLSMGNPNLGPEDYHRLGFSFSMKKNLSMGVSGVFSKNKIVNAWYADDGGRTVQTYANAGKYRGVSANFGYYIILKNQMYFTFRGVAGYDYKQSLSEVSEFGTVNTTLSANIPVYKTLSIATNFSYNDMFSNGSELMRIDPFNWGIQLSCSFFKRRLEVETYFTNILKFNTFSGIEIGKEDFWMLQENRCKSIPIRVRLAWRFGTFKVKSVRKARRGAVIDDISTGER